jgi:hypothetical protein
MGVKLADVLSRLPDNRGRTGADRPGNLPARSPQAVWHGIAKGGEPPERIALSFNLDREGMSYA